MCAHPAAKFSGNSNEYYELTNTAAGRTLNLTSYTIEFWLKPENPAIGNPWYGGNWYGVLEKQNRTDYEIWISHNAAPGNLPQLQCYYYRTGGATAFISANLPDWDRWYHVAFAHDGTNVQLYLDGQLKGSANNGATLLTANDPIHLGCVRKSSAYLRGQIAEFRIWEGIRTAAQIQQNMNHALDPDNVPSRTSPVAGQASLVHYWTFENGTAADLSRNRNTSNSVGSPGPRIIDADGLNIAPANLLQTGTAISSKPLDPLRLAFYRFLTADTLQDRIRQNQQVDRIVDRNITFTIDNNDQTLQPTNIGPEYKRLVRIPLQDEGQELNNLNADTDFSVEISVGIKQNTAFTSTDIDGQICVVLSDTENAVGIEVRPTKDYLMLGPYRGIEGRCDPDQLSHIAYIPDETGGYGALEYLLADKDEWDIKTFDTTKVPESFQITLKPKAAWARCYSAVEGGHTASVGPYFRAINPARWNASNPNEIPFLEVYTKGNLPNYFLQYLEVTVYKV